MPFADSNDPNFQESELEYNKKQADFQIPELKLAYDITIREPEHFNAAYKAKRQKYKKIYFGKEI